jgi:hypothetical protein
LKLVIAAAAALLPMAPLAPPHDEARPSSGSSGKTVVDDRFSISSRFADLDAYLAHLRRQSAIDGAWYREIRPGVYELQTGGNLRLDRGEKTKRVFTRDELERKFGFQP